MPDVAGSSGVGKIAYGKTGRNHRESQKRSSQRGLHETRHSAHRANKRKRENSNCRPGPRTEGGGNVDSIQRRVRRHATQVAWHRRQDVLFRSNRDPAHGLLLSRQRKERRFAAKKIHGRLSRRAARAHAKHRADDPGREIRGRPHVEKRQGADADGNRARVRALLANVFSNRPSKSAQFWMAQKKSMVRAGSRPRTPEAGQRNFRQQKNGRILIPAVLFTRQSPR